MTLTSALLPAILAVMLPSSAAPAPKMLASPPTEGAQNFLPRTHEDRDGQKCEMKAAKLVLLVPEEPRPNSASFWPGDTDLCLYYLGKR